MTEECGNCRFFSRHRCRRSPPVRLPRKFDESASRASRVRDENLLWGWPAVETYDWCGEYRPAAQKEEKSGTLQK